MIKRTVILLMFNCILLQVGFTQQSKIDSLQKILSRLSNDTNKINIINKITYLYLTPPVVDYEKALKSGEDSRVLAEKLGFERGVAYAYDNLGTTYGYYGLYEKAFENYLNLLRVLEKLNDTVWLLQANRKLAFLYSATGNTKKTLEIYLKLTKLAEATSDKKKIQDAYWNSASAYLNVCKEMIKQAHSTLANYNYDKAVEFNNKALQIAKEQNNVQDIAFLLGSTAYFYDKCNVCNEANLVSETDIIKANHYKKAEENHLRSLAIYQQLKDSEGISNCYYNLGLFYRNQGNLFAQSNKRPESKQLYRKSLGYFIQAFQIINELGYRHGIAYYGKEVGIAYLKSNKLSQAKKYLSDAAKGFTRIGFREGAKESYQKLAEVYLQLKDYKNAYNAYETYTVLKDSLTNESILKLQNEKTIVYETQKKDDSLKLQSQNLIISQKTISNRNTLLAVVGAGSAMLIILLFLLFRTYNKTRLAKEKIELLQREVHHRVKNNLAIIARLAEVAGQQSSESIPVKVLENRIKSIAYLHEQLYMQDDMTIVSFQPFIERLVHQVNNSMATKVADTSVNADIEIDTNKAIPLALIINELVTNSYKYAFEEMVNPSIKIDIERNKRNEIVVSYNDNGRGSTEKSNSSRQSGYGIRLIKGLSSQLGGKYSVWNDKGYNFELIIPQS